MLTFICTRKVAPHEGFLYSKFAALNLDKTLRTYSTRYAVILAQELPCEAFVIVLV